MQRLLARTPSAAGLALAGRALEEHASITRILQSRLGQDHANLLAVPTRLADGQIEWTTGAAGDIVGMGALPEAQRLALQQRAERLCREIRGLAGAMRAEGGAAATVGEMLAQAAQWPPGDWLYSVGGKPVAVMWGHGDGQAAVPSAAAAAADDVVNATPLQAVPRRPVALWVANAMLALLFLGALYGAMNRYLALQETERLRAAELAALGPANAALQEQIARKRALTSQLVCVALPPPPPQVAAAPEVPAPAASAASAVSAASAPPKPAKVVEAKNLCPGERPKELAPELAIVFDASGSMAYSLNATEQDIMAASVRQQQMPIENLMRTMRGQPPITSGGMASVLQEPTRMTSARQAALSVVQRAPSDAGIGLVLIERCPGARGVGYFPPARRAEVTAHLQSVRPTDGTPLADGVAQGGALLNGVKRDALMVVISDGVESCGGDPCAAAAALARSKPRLKINVVDITGTGAGNCLAKATRGKVFTARNAGEVAAMTARAAQDVMAPANCKKP